MSRVAVKVYDLSQGMARQLSPTFLGRQIDGIWHTGVEVFGREYYFGGGICSDSPGSTPYGTPIQQHDLGTTTKTLQQFTTFLSSISSRFTIQSYHLLDNNCNNFSDECCMFLAGKHIPQHILDLPSIAMNSPLGPFIRPVIDQMQSAIQQQSMGHQVDFSTSTTDASQSPSPTSLSSSSSISHQYYNSPILLSKANLEAITRKLNETLPTYAQNYSVPELVALCIDEIPLDKAFPILDRLRMLILDNVNDAEEYIAAYPLFLQRFVIDDQSPDSACLMTLRGGVNCFKYQSCSQMLYQQDISNILITAIQKGLSKQKTQIVKTTALLAYNFSGAHPRHPSQVPKLNNDDCSRLTFTLMKKINNQTLLPMDEARLILQALVVLADNYPNVMPMIKILRPGLEIYTNHNSCQDEQVVLAANQLTQLLPSPSSS